jgi:hypothetical protein
MSVLVELCVLGCAAYETDRVTRLVVARDGNVDELQRGVSVTEGNDAGIWRTS